MWKINFGGNFAKGTIAKPQGTMAIAVVAVGYFEACKDEIYLLSMNLVTFSNNNWMFVFYSLKVVVSIASDNSKASDTKDQPSIVTQLNNDIEDIQATRLDFKTKNADLEQALQKSAADLKNFKQRLEQLQLEKQDLLSLNNELQTMVSIYSRSGKRPQANPSVRDAGVDQTMEEVESEFTFERPGESFPAAGEQEATQTNRSKCSSPGVVASPTTVVQKTNIALQDVLLQLKAEREKVTSLMEDLKKEREDRNKIETTLMEQLNACSGEHHTAVENLNHKHQEQVSELSRKLDELAIANQVVQTLRLLIHGCLSGHHST